MNYLFVLFGILFSFTAVLKMQLYWLIKNNSFILV